MSPGKRPKRSREGEDSSPPPVSKQSKIDDFFGEIVEGYNIHVYNKFAVLAEGEEEKTAERTATTKTKPASLTDEGNCCDNERKFSNLLDLTFVTVKCILEHLKEINGKLVTLTELGTRRIIEKELCCPASSVIMPGITPASPKNKNLLSDSSLQSTRVDGSTRLQLILQPKQICLSVCRYQGGWPSWDTKMKVLKHLSILLGLPIARIDLKTLETISQPNQIQRVLITFLSGKIPSQIMRQSKILKNKGVFPARVFLNISKPAPLLPCFSKKHKESRATHDLITLQPDLMDPFCQREVTVKALEKHLSVTAHMQKPEAINLDNSLEDDLLKSFPYLPKEDQVAVVNRLEKLRAYLLESGGDIRNQNINFPVKSERLQKSPLLHLNALLEPARPEAEVDANANVNEVISAEVSRMGNPLKPSEPQIINLSSSSSMPDLESSYNSPMASSSKPVSDDITIERRGSELEVPLDGKIGETHMEVSTFTHSSALSSVPNSRSDSDWDSRVLFCIHSSHTAQAQRENKSLAQELLDAEIQEWEFTRSKDCQGSLEKKTVSLPERLGSSLLRDNQMVPPMCASNQEPVLQISARESSNTPSPGPLADIALA